MITSKNIDQNISLIQKDDLKLQANNYPSWQLTDRQICDLELLLNGGFSPLNGFMNKLDYISVLKNMRLENSSLWPMPITLDISDEFADLIKDKEKIVWITFSFKE